VSSQHALPGWFGKLPGMGDFAHRRLPARFLQNWDRWLQEGLANLRLRHADDWTAHYLQSPLWCFALGADTVDTQAWIGVLMPSVDGVGRYFPFALIRGFDAGINAADWWTRAAAVALDALDGDLDAQCLETLLAQRFGAAGAPGQDAPPLPEQSLWRTQRQDGSILRFAHTGLPRGNSFNALFGFARDTPAQPQECSPS
jgi:type VI secretion system protein ImpM